MNILLVNDDGIMSLGIRILEEILSRFGNVYVCAPSQEQSAKSISIKCFLGLEFQLIDETHLMCNGTPADCVQLGLAYFKEKNIKIDLVVSGCNNGWNIQEDIMYSGTCGAALQGLFAGIPSIAFSSYNHYFFNDLYQLVPKTISFLIEKKLISKEYMLNINFPNEFNDIRFKITRINLPIKKQYSLIYDEKTNKYYIDRNERELIDDDSIDYICLKKGFVSITPLSQSTFNMALYHKLNKKIR